MKETQASRVVDALQKLDMLLDTVPLSPIQHEEHRRLFDDILHAVGISIEWVPRSSYTD